MLKPNSIWIIFNDENGCYYGIVFDIRINDHMQIFCKWANDEICMFEDISFGDMFINEIK